MKETHLPRSRARHGRPRFSIFCVAFIRDRLETCAGYLRCSGLAEENRGSGRAQEFCNTKRTIGISKRLPWNPAVCNCPRGKLELREKGTAALVWRCVFRRTDISAFKRAHRTLTRVRCVDPLTWKFISSFRSIVTISFARCEGSRVFTRLGVYRGKEGSCG